MVEGLATNGTFMFKATLKKSLLPSFRRKPESILPW